MCGAIKRAGLRLGIKREGLGLLAIVPISSLAIVQVPIVVPLPLSATLLAIVPTQQIFHGWPPGLGLVASRGR
jgi:hypothetical protein